MERICGRVFRNRAKKRRKRKISSDYSELFNRYRGDIRYTCRVAVSSSRHSGVNIGINSNKIAKNKKFFKKPVKIVDKQKNMWYIYD